MSIFRMPEGVEIDLKVYAVGLVENVETEVVIAVRGLTSLSESVRQTLDLQHIIESYDLEDLGSGWRTMTREEITNYKSREESNRCRGYSTISTESPTRSSQGTT